MHAVSRLASMLAAATFAFAAHAENGPLDSTADYAMNPVEALRLRAGILRAENERDTSDHLLAEALRSRDVVVRQRAVRALGRIGDEASVPALQKLVVDGYPPIQREAIFALGEIESPAARETLVHALGSKDAAERALACEALAKIAAAAPEQAELCARPVLALILTPGAESDPATLRRALLSSWRLGAKTDGTVQSISAAFLRPETEISTAAIYAAARMGDARFEPLLALAAHDERPMVRALASGGLGRLARLPGDAAIKSNENRAILVRRGLDVDPLPRIAAFGALAAFPADQKMAAEMLAPSLAASADHGSRRAALALVKAWSLGATADELAAMAVGPDDDIAVDAAGALAAVAGDGAIPTLAAMAVHPTWQRRAAAAEALAAARFASGEGRALLDGLLKDADARVVASALEAAVATGREDAAVLALAHLGAEDVVVRAVAADGLANLAGKGAIDNAEALAALRRAWGDGLRDASPDARLSALDSVARLLDGRLPPLVAWAARDSDYTVRLKAKAMAEKAGFEPPVPVGLVGAKQPWSFYEAAARDEIAAAPRYLQLDTTRGPLYLQLAPAEAILTVRHLTALAGSGYFDGLTFHRVVPGFVAQGGDPRGDGWGGPGTAIRCEINRLRYDRGAAGMALSGKDTGGSQFFFTLTEQPHLDGGYTVFGQLEPSSLAVVDQIQRFDVITKATVHEGSLADLEPPSGTGATAGGCGMPCCEGKPCGSACKCPPERVAK